MVEKKCVIVLAEDLPNWSIANTAAILGASLGKNITNMVGNDFIDRTGHSHKGITQVPMPILKSHDLNSLREKIKPYEDETYVVDLTNYTQNKSSYKEYVEAFMETPLHQLVYLGIAIYGPKKIINSLTGNLGLLR